MLPVALGFLAAALTAVDPPPDGFVVASGRGGTPHLFRIDPATGDARNLAGNPAAPELFPAVSPDGRRLAYVAAPAVGRPLRLTVADADGANPKAVSPEADALGDAGPTWNRDGTRLAYARNGGPGKWEVRTVAADGSDDAGVRENALFPAFSPDGTRLAFADLDPDRKTLRLATMNPDGSDVKFLTGPMGRAEMMGPAWSPDGRTLAFSAEAGNGIELFRVDADGSNLRRLTHLGGGSLHPVWLSDRDILFTHVARAVRGYLTIRADGTRLQPHPLTKFDTPHEFARVAVRPPAYREPDANPVRPVAHAEPAKAPPAPAVREVGWAGGASLDAAWSPVGSVYAGASAEGPIGLSGVAPGGLRNTVLLPGHAAGTTALAWSADGKKLYSAGRDRTVRLWDPATQECVATAADPADVGYALAADPAGGWVAFAAAGEVSVRDPATLKPVRSFPFVAGKKAEVGTLLASADGGTLYAAGGSSGIPVMGGAVAAFDPATGEEKWRAKGTFGGVVRAALSPDGTKLAGGCTDTSVRVWDAATGKELARWPGHADRVLSVSWSADGKRVASGAADHTVRVWDAATGAVVSTVSAHVTPVVRVGFSPDGKHLLTAGLDRLLVWRVE